jgi:hypothetical protein
LTQNGNTIVASTTIVKDLKTHFSATLITDTSSDEDKRVFFNRFKPRLQQKLNEIEDENSHVNLMLQVIPSFTPPNNCWGAIEALHLRQPFRDPSALWEAVGSICFQVYAGAIAAEAETRFKSLSFTGLSGTAAADYEISLLQAGLDAELSVPRIVKKYLQSLRDYAATRPSQWGWLPLAISRWFSIHAEPNHCFYTHKTTPISLGEMHELLYLFLEFRKELILQHRDAIQDYSDTVPSINAIAPANTSTTAKRPRRPCPRCKGEHHVSQCSQPDTRTPQEKQAASEKFKKWAEANPEKAAALNAKRTKHKDQPKAMATMMAAITSIAARLETLERPQ